MSSKHFSAPHRRRSCADRNIAQIILTKVLHLCHYSVELNIRGSGAGFSPHTEKIWCKRNFENYCSFGHRREQLRTTPAPPLLLNNSLKVLEKRAASMLPKTDDKFKIRTVSLSKKKHSVDSVSQKMNRFKHSRHLLQPELLGLANRPISNCHSAKRYFDLRLRAFRAIFTLLFWNIFIIT